MAIERIKLNLIPAGTMPVCHASQYDKKRQIGIDIYNGLQPYILSDELLELDVRKPDGHIVTIDVPYTAGGNGIVFETTEQMCAVAGSNLCELKITKGEAEIGSLNFYMEIEKSPMENGLASDSEIANLRTQMQSIAQPMLDDLVPPIVETLVPEVVGDNYYNKNEINNIVSGIDDALEDIGHDIDGINDDIDNLETELENKANTTYVDTELAKKADKSNTYTKSEVDTLIDNLPEPMIFKGTLGVGGTIQSLPTASAINEGWTYKVITDGTYAGQTAKVGDVFTSNGSTWVLIPSGDEDNDTWRAIKVEGDEVLGNGISSGAVDFVGSENIEIEYDGDGKIKTKTKNIYTKEEVDDIVYNILPDDTASGSVANFETDLALPIKSLEIDVNAKQDLHGYDYPWTAGGGKNLYPLISPDTKNGITLTNDNGVITLNGTATADAYFDIDNLNISLPSGSKLYICAFNSVAAETRLSLFLITNNIGNPQVNMNNANAILDTTINADAIGTRLRLRVPNGATYSNFKLSPYLQIGGNAPTSFSPYENICPIEGWNEIYLKRCKKNWFDKDTAPIVTGYIDANGFNINNYKSRTTYIKIPSGSTFTVTKIASARFTLATAKNPPVSGEPLTVRVANYSQATKLTITAGSEDRYLWLWFYLYDTDTETYEDVLNSIQVEVGSTETAYEPYAGNEYIINLGGTYYGGHFTQDKAGHRQFEVTHSELLDMGDIEWSNFDASIGIFKATQLPNCKAPVSTADRKTGFMCTDYPASANVSINENMTDKSLLRYNGWLILRDTSFSSYTEVAEGVRGAKLFYELATPIIIDLPDGEPIITLNGTNNIFADTGDTSVVFKNSVNGYVEKKIASVQALALNT